LSSEVGVGAARAKTLKAETVIREYFMVKEEPEVCAKRRLRGSYKSRSRL
jgi:hypothetical protein